MVEAVGTHPTKFSYPAVIAIGKAAAAMYSGWCEANRGVQRVIMVVPDGVTAPDWAIRGEHPIPGLQSVKAAAAVEAFIGDQVRSGRVDGFVLLLSGGASALLTSPAQGLSVADIANMTMALLRAGAPIGDLNRVRKHLERLKGGRMAALMSPLPVVAFLLSDVPQNDLEALGSGPVFPDGSTFADALKVLKSFEIEHAPIQRFLEAGAAGQHPETPKHGDPVVKQVRYTLIGSNADAVNTAGRHLSSSGFELGQPVQRLAGDAAECGRRLSMIAKAQLARLPTAIVWGGETTVRVGVADGKGGRNQELALAAAIVLDGIQNVAVASFATDGVDGPTEAAGALVTGETCRQARQVGLDPAAALFRHDSYTFFTTLEKSGSPHLLRTGPTGTNVNDVAIALIY